MLQASIHHCRFLCLRGRDRPYPGLWLLVLSGESTDGPSVRADTGEQAAEAFLDSTDKAKVTFRYVY